MLKKYILICIILISAVTSFAQGVPGGGGTGPGSGEPGGNLDPGNGQEPPVGGGVPVDGGLAFLLAAGAGYGAKKAYDYRKKNIKSEK